jgi:hypothetical protein
MRTDPTAIASHQRTFCLPLNVSTQLVFKWSSILEIMSAWWLWLHENPYSSMHVFKYVPIDATKHHSHPSVHRSASHKDASVPLDRSSIDSTQTSLI